MMKKVKLVHNTVIKLKKKLYKRKSSDMSIQMDAIYYSCRILYKILFSFNISYALTQKFETFIKKGFGLISSEELGNKIDDLIGFCDDILVATKSFKNKHCG